MPHPHIALVGTTGVVGRQVLSAFLAKDLPAEDLRLFASERTVGDELDYGEESLEVEAIEPGSFRGLKAAVLATPVEVAKSLALELQREGVWVVDCSGAFRVDPKVPLIASGVNTQRLQAPFEGRIVSVTHPATLAALTVLEALKAKWGLVLADLTILGGAALFGNAGVDRLSKQTADLMNGKDPDVETFAHRLAFNVIPAAGPLEHGLAQLERHVLVEAARVYESLNHTPPALTATSVLVPTYHGLTLLLTAHLGQPTDVDAVRAAVKAHPSLKLLDDPDQNVYPMPMLVTDDPTIHVGRVRVLKERVQLVVCIDNAVLLASKAVELALELARR